MSALILLGNWIKKCSNACMRARTHTTDLCLPRRRVPLRFTIFFLNFIFRRKYEFLQFLDSEENLSCPFIPSHGRTSSSGQSSSSNNIPLPEKKRYDKQTTKNRIGLSFRNSWGRKDSENRTAKKSTSLVMFHFITTRSIIHLLKSVIVKSTSLYLILNRKMSEHDKY